MTAPPTPEQGISPAAASLLLRCYIALSNEGASPFGADEATDDAVLAEAVRVYRSTTDPDTPPTEHDLWDCGFLTDGTHLPCSECAWRKDEATR